MKKLICFFIIMLLCLSSCSSNEIEEKTDKRGEIVGISYNNTLPCEKLITKEYDAKEFSFYMPYTTAMIMSSWHPDLDEINEEYPIECFRKTNRKGKEACYAIYKINGGNLYVFFLKNVVDVYAYNDARDYCAFACFNMTKKLEEADFSLIKKGSLVDDIISIDSSTILFSFDDNIGLSNHVLSDGSIFRINYKKTINGWEVSDYDIMPQLVKSFFEYLLPIDRFD